MADAGRIVIIPKGEYKSNITYERLDAVEYNNNGYIALKTVTGITPTNDGTNWALYVKGTPVDSELSTTSTNAIQNKIVTAEISALKKENTQQSTEINEVRKETTTNVCPFPMATATVNNVTCTNNNDGTFTLNGTASDLTTFVVSNNTVIPLLKKFAGKKMKLTGVEHGSSSTYYIQFWSNVDSYAVSENRNGVVVSMPDISNITSAAAANIAIIVRSGATMNNEIVKPMFTTNLDATYDDFVPYTGNTGSLNGDVASLLKKIQALESQFASSTSELCSDAIDDLASVVSTQDEAIDELATIVTESEEK